MIKNIYLLEWYGPFPNPQEIVKWEKKNIGNGKTYLYLLKGKNMRDANIHIIAVKLSNKRQENV